MSGTLRHTFVLTEEVVRWAFEVHVRNDSVASKNWSLVFSNPTAGPWKRLMAPDHEGLSVEVLRFGRNEDRPDLVLVSDPLRLVLIVEAKDSISKLVEASQMKKTVQVVTALSRRLSESTISVWQTRREYAVLSGFLWPNSTTGNDFDRLYDAYDKHSAGKPLIGLIGTLTPEGLVHLYGGRGSAQVKIDEVGQSLAIQKSSGC